jgi:hypothetical protein
MRARHSSVACSSRVLASLATVCARAAVSVSTRWLRLRQLRARRAVGVLRGALFRLRLQARCLDAQFLRLNPQLLGADLGAARAVVNQRELQHQRVGRARRVARKLFHARLQHDIGQQLRAHQA